MKKTFKKSLVVLLGITLSLQTSFLQVQAHDWRAYHWGPPPPPRPWGPPPPPRWHHHHHNNDALVGGIVGFATGMVVGGMISDRPPPPPPRRVYVYEQPQPPIIVYRNRLTPWTDEWRMYCYRRYNSFNENTGTYIDYNGEERFCTN
ncbi:hypothetical protein B488_00650 [Liberibacter crescens BT-1]|uniref:Lectin-like protein BA14k n=1 Tax=Liberibacter crescens (strain BT-1) TaxID=1215343 RepID=L0ETU9_LIBCB|nr:BA14K family protein [Liberibacter crescens]AGA64058.1 hypothetical protein B488_00650 [Liberibacter crescens BT-1]